MLDYPILQMIFAVFFMAIFTGFVAAIGWCDPSQYKRRPVLLVISILFTVFGIYEIVRVCSLCSSAVSPGESLIGSISGIFNAIYEEIAMSDFIRFADDQINSLVFSGASVVLTAIAFVFSFVFAYILAFRIALRIDLSLKNSVRYIILGSCTLLTLIVGIVTSQFKIMVFFLVFDIVSIGFLIYGNYRLNKFSHKKSNN